MDTLWPLDSFQCSHPSLPPQTLFLAGAASAAVPRVRPSFSVQPFRGPAPRGSAHSGSRTQPQHHRCGPGSAWLFLRRLCRCLAAPTSRPRSAALQPSSSSSGCHRRVCLHPSRSWSRGPMEWSRLWTPSQTHILRQSRYMRVAEEASCVGTVMQTLVTHRFVMRRCLYTTDPVLGLQPP